ncbi:methyl-accepting chemotaxis protein [Chromobacterium paludis]|uniref:Methyl-accepting chemotaxis protein n=1 Tax=Chromobacterium paludis TaxID=2605945 RepID=A0A5C1DHK6_9NEIS|nr:methyl-accepting chemotaxis protein [Chromobacterium paludis]QEL55108.1 methyl-accepting chemotaxis protein [Chromobacterium paludis]
MKLGSGGLVRQLSLAVAGFVVVTGLVATGVDFYLSTTASNQLLREQIDSAGQLYASHLSGWLASKTKVLDSFPNTTDPAQLDAQLAYARDAASFDNVFIAYPDGTLANANHIKLPPDNNDPRKWNWFKRAYAEPNHAFVDMPSIAAATGQPVSSMARALVRGGKIVAILGADMQIASIVKELQYLKVMGDGFMFIANRDGKVFAHADTALLNKPVSMLGPGLSGDVLQSMAGQGDFRDLQVNGQDSLVRAYAIPHSDYILVVVSRRDALLAPLYARLGKTLAALAVVLVLVLLLSRAYIGSRLAGLVRVRDAMSEIASGDADLTRRIAVSGEDEVGETAGAFNAFSEHLSQVIVALRGKSKQLTDGVGEVGDLVSRLAADASQLADISGNNASAIQQVTISVSNIAQTAQDTDQLVSATQRISAGSAEDMRRISDKMAATRQSVAGLAGMLEVLGQRSQEISKITNVISDISDQTNLLALNAAIEAARAGETGRGFAVVADEVRKLAERTGQATVEISDMVTSISSEVERALGNMRGTTDMVAESAQLTDAARESLSGMVAAMLEIKQKIGDIASATHEQRQSTQSMALSTESINAQIVQSDERMGSTRDVLLQLEQVADEMSGTFERFKA